ncbi:HEL341Wp [Eremothecium sinecaudum]|uniref:HDL566Wp n=1 Tax=Eremothecium sinecaudum TaxID=45286 RepID=A0A109UZ37_9SACH|nr:HDL566Wp [Eremothecium sinecaudum]XP_017987936.1 HEL341Wp [Eremothecium sinecaudum]AMD20178.1 HDL566Wp [Eremothecium sinecaudum]AMD20940.1 HEL341Wp [Eremothecium sinecaudum]
MRKITLISYKTTMTQLPKRTSTRSSNFLKPPGCPKYVFILGTKKPTRPRNKFIIMRTIFHKSSSKIVSAIWKHSPNQFQKYFQLLAQFEHNSHNHNHLPAAALTDADAFLLIARLLKSRQQKKKVKMLCGRF